MQVQYNTVQESERTTNPEEDTMKQELFIREMEIKRKYNKDRWDKTKNTYKTSLDNPVLRNLS